MICKLPSQVFSSFDLFLNFLRERGFEPEIPAASSLHKDSAAIWNKLVQARSWNTSAPTQADWAYLQKLGKNDGEKVSQWGLVLVEKKLVSSLTTPQLPLLAVKMADAAMDALLTQLSPPQWSGSSAAAPNGVQVEEHVVIGPDCKIGEGTILESGVRLGARVRIGARCRIGANSRLADDTILGDDCVLTGLNALGSQGFGLLRYPHEKHLRQRLHVGRVVVGNRVRMGAYVSVDRGVFEDTVIGDDCMFDNHVQVAHNTRIGTDSIFCSFVGLSGSTQIGNFVTFAGMSSTKDHVSVGDRVTVTGLTGVSHSLEPDQVVKGYPPRPLTEALKIQALTLKLPELYERLKKLESKS